MGFVGNFLLFPVVFFENQLRFDEVTAMSLVASFYVDTLQQQQQEQILITSLHFSCNTYKLPSTLTTAEECIKDMLDTFNRKCSSMILRVS